MADYSFVNDPDGQIKGLWLRNIDDSRNPISLLTLLKKHQGRLAEIRKPISDDLINMVLSQNYRIVPNKFDKQGGCFVMFGQVLASGEERKRVDQSERQVIGTKTGQDISIIFVFILFPKSFSQNAIVSFEKEHKERLIATLKTQYASPNADVVFVIDWKCKDLTWVDKTDIQNKTPEILAGINQAITPLGFLEREPDVLLKSCYFAIDPDTGALIITLPLAGN
jgi:hypothetical protein